MGGGFTGSMTRKIRQNIKKGHILDRIGKMVESGVYPEPTWYQAAKEAMPLLAQPMSGKFRKTIVFPTDELVLDFQKRNPQVMDEPMSQNASTPSVSFQFACQQYALMQQGMEKEEAYRAAEDKMREESESKIRANRRLIESARAVAGTGTAPSFFADEKVYQRLLEWKDLMSEKPYELWEEPPKAALLHWIMLDVMRYDHMQLKAARSMNDGTMEEIEANAQSLLHALFPGSIFHKGKINMRYRFEEPKWLEQHQSWSLLVRKQPLAYLWNLESRVNLSDWILEECMDREQVEMEMNKVLHEGSADELVWEVHLAKLELFPGIRLHKLQTPDPMPQPSFLDGLPETNNVTLLSSVYNTRVAPYRGAARTMGEGETDGTPYDPKYGWAFAGVAGGARQQAMMEIALDNSHMEIKDKHYRNRMELYKRELMNPIEKVLLEAARKTRRIDQASKATAFEEMRLIQMGQTEKVSGRLTEYGKSAIFDRIMAAELEKNKDRKAEFTAEQIAEEEAEQLFLQAKRRRRDARLEREAQLAREAAERAQRDAAADRLPQLVVPEKSNKHFIRF